MAEQLFNIKFVKEVEKRPCLYNYTMKEYCKKEITDQAWEEVGLTVNLTRAECKEKWKNLRSVFVRNLKFPKTGQGSTKKAYYLSSYMQFTLPFIKLHKRPEEYMQVMNNEPPVDNSLLPDDESILPDDSRSQSPFVEIPVEHQEFEDALYLNEELNQNNDCNKNTKQKMKSEESRTEKIIGNYFKMKRSKLSADVDYNNEKTSNKLFLLSMLPDMNKMSEKKRRMFKRRLLDLVDELMDEDIG